MANNISGGLRLTGLDDFITPSQACIKPLASSSSGSSNKVAISLEDDGSYVQIHQSGTREVLSKAQISLNDCLACSGCVTSAESVLISAQSLDQFRAEIQRVKEDPSRRLVVSLSPQSRASLAHHFSLSLSDAHSRLVSLFKTHAAAAAVVDTSFSRSVSLLETLHEFLARKQTPTASSSSPSSVSPSLPMLSSACPGWVCYAEKRHGSYILPYISTAKSPQQVMGAIVKRHLARSLETSPGQIFHVAVMPCYDKKLEASRPDFEDAAAGTKEVDCVLTTGEILEFIRDCGLAHLDVLPAHPLEGLPLSNFAASAESPFSVQPFASPGGSGGYAEYLYRHAASILYQSPGAFTEPLPWVVSRNKDMQTATLSHEGKPVLKVSLVYGFRNIQTLVRQIKSKRCDIDFAEVMACPSGCLNGGGQIKPEASEDRSAASQVTQALTSLYHSQANVLLPALPEGDILQIYQEFCPTESAPYSPLARQHFHTRYHDIPPMESSLPLQW